MSKQVQDFIEGLGQWREEIRLLRQIMIKSPLIEDYKWMHPCYTFKNKNIVLIQNFKDYCALGFPQGVLLNDPTNSLIQPTENSQTARQMRFRRISEIQKKENIILQLIDEAIDKEKAGVKAQLKGLEDYEVPEELKQFFKENEDYKEAFKALSPGRQKGYLLHFGGAKQSTTRLSRIEKSKARVIKGYGLQDCICGQSKRMPNCDGSHNKIKNK